MDSIFLSFNETYNFFDNLSLTLAISMRKCGEQLRRGGDQTFQQVMVSGLHNLISTQFLSVNLSLCTPEIIVLNDIFSCDSECSSSRMLGSCTEYKSTSRLHELLFCVYQDCSLKLPHSHIAYKGTSPPHGLLFCVEQDDP